MILTGNPTTGYSWTALGDKTRPCCSSRVTRSTLRATDQSIVGGGGTFTFTFKAAAAGQVTLKFDYARPFETGVHPSRPTR